MWQNNYTLLSADGISILGSEDYEQVVTNKNYN